MDEPIQALEQQLRELQTRVDALTDTVHRLVLQGELRAADSQVEATAATSMELAAQSARIYAAVSARLRERTQGDGAIAATFYSVVMRTDTSPASWVSEQEWRRDLEPEELSERARVLAALGSDARLRLLLMLWEGEKAASDLSDVTGLSTGSLYHHMRELIAFRWVGTPQRNRYTLTLLGRKALVTAYALAGALVET